MTFNEFTHQFASEKDCRDYLYRLRFQNGFICPKCGHTKAWPIGGTLYECAKCGHQTSVIAGTIFQDTRKPLREWITAIWWITTQKNGASAQGPQQVLGLKSYKTAWAWPRKIRTAMVCSNREKLSGTVETDETYLGGSEKGGKRGRGSENKAVVAIAVEVKGKPLGRVRMNIINDATSGSLQGFIKGSIEPGAALITDGWCGYSGIEGEGYLREIFNQSNAESDKEMLPHVHMIVSLLKRWLLGTHQGAVRKKHLQAYLDEFVFRFNRRKSTKCGLLFYRLLENAMKVPPTTLDELFK
jgi:transposase-like protein/Zn ribbon nucleic-acid-binding protein